MPSYGFLSSLRAAGCPEPKLEQVLRMTETLLLRRHICRERTNENEKLFAGLGEMSIAERKNPLKRLEEEYREMCPPDEKFAEEFANAKFSGGLMSRARYCLEQLELQKHGDYDELALCGSEDVHVEHIIPQKIKSRRDKQEQGDWPEYLGNKSDALHSKHVSRIGNLTLFAGELNISASNNPYKAKQAIYKRSGLELTKALAKDYPEFRFAQVDQRGAEMAQIALEIWPMP